MLYVIRIFCIPTAKDKNVEKVMFKEEVICSTSTASMYGGGFAMNIKSNQKHNLRWKVFSMNSKFLALN